MVLIATLHSLHDLHRLRPISGCGLVHTRAEPQPVPCLSCLRVAETSGTAVVLAVAVGPGDAGSTAHEHDVVTPRERGRCFVALERRSCVSRFLARDAVFNAVCPVSVAWL